MPILILQRLFLEIVLDIFYFPVWWYTKGALYALGRCFDLLKQGNTNLAPGLWLANIFIPMFGQYDVGGRIVSFFMRLVQIIARTFALFLWTAVCGLLFVAWLLAPVLVFYGVAYAI
ncbi:MAG: hypothetical protein HYT15_02260 [Candidatus Magasanikbacteria bacterium]|nr:hypothetical protein [Candidatus Magasanikbacteria bacterium]